MLKILEMSVWGATFGAETDARVILEERDPFLFATNVAFPPVVCNFDKLCNILVSGESKGFYLFISGHEIKLLQVYSLWWRS